jgi:hypothetical protein
MAKVCLANEIGPEACWLLTIIAHTEDAKGYRGPVTYFNEQLFPLVGLGSVSSLLRAREKCVRSGWLHHDGGSKGRAARYWVVVPPHCDGIPDSATDEKAGELTNIPSAGDEQSGENAERKRKTSGKKAEDKRKESDEHSSLAQDNLAQDSPPADAVAEAVTPRPRNLLFDAVAEVTGSEPAIVGGRIGSLAAKLAKATPPYTPEEVRAFGRRFGEFCPWGPEKGRMRPTLNELKDHIGKVRAGAPPPQRGQRRTADDAFTKFMTDVQKMPPPEEPL